MQNGEKRQHIQRLLDNLAKTLPERQARREQTYRDELDPDNMKKYIKTSMAGLGSWLRRER